MKRTVLVAIVFFISHSIMSQELMKKIPLKEGVRSDIKYDDLNINTLLQVYDDGDISLRVDNNDESIVKFYLNSNTVTKDYYTKVYKNYFLTFTIENNNKYLIIEQARFGKTFALSSDGSVTIGNKEDAIEIEITDYVHEWGYDAPPEDPNSSYFNDVQYTLKVKAKDIVKDFWISSSELELKGNFSIDFASYTILILSDKYGEKSSLLEMIIDKKKEK